MRTGGHLFHTVSKMTTAEATTTAKSTFSPPATSPWHSPVPYLFGGLAAMLGLIAFALLILACSYWKLSGSSSEDRDLESDKGDNTSDAKALPVFEDKFLVIMAGDNKPSFLATPKTTTNTISFDNKNVDNQQHKIKDENIKHKDETETTRQSGQQDEEESHVTQEQIQ